MSDILIKSFGVEMDRIENVFRSLAIWPCPNTGLALHLLQLSEFEVQDCPVITVSPDEFLDVGPTAAIAGYAMCFQEPSRELVAKYADGLRRLSKCQPFPHDRQTFAYRPTELLGLALGIVRTCSGDRSLADWLLQVIKEIPSKDPPDTPWALLLYQYASSLIGSSFSIRPPARIDEYGTTELALLTIFLRLDSNFGGIQLSPDAVQATLLERIASTTVAHRKVEHVGALLGGLNIGIRNQLRAMGNGINPRRHSPMKRKVLFLAANPSGSTKLALDEECRAITERIRASEHRESIELITRWAVRPDDLLQHLNEHRPHVVHFCGHGSPSGAIIMLDKDRNSLAVPAPALTHLFATLKDNIRVVVLNACYSEAQANAIIQVVDCAIGMNDSIGDEAAIAFSAAFYQALGFGRSVKTAFDSGRAALMLSGIREEDTPVLLQKDGINAQDVFLIGG